MDIQELIESEDLHLKKMQELVTKSIEEENLLSRKLIEAEENLDMSFAEKLTDQIADFGGSWTFIILFFLTIITWIMINVLNLTKELFDPYPFILLNLVLSCLAAFQAPIIMMSQNRQEDKDRRRARNDYMINLKSEIEIRNLHDKLDLITTEQLKTIFEVQKKQLEMIEHLSAKLEKLKQDL